jgi:hypothetical protein
MATRAQTEKAESAKKGLPKKRAKKLAQRKPTKTSRAGARVAAAPRTKRDTAAVIAHEVAVSTPEAKAARAASMAKRVRAKR